MALTLKQKEAARYHLGYQNISTPEAIALGFPTASQLLFITESAFNNLLPEGEARVLSHVSELDCIEKQMSKFRESLEVEQVGTTKFRGSDAFWELENQYQRWSEALANQLGTPINPFSLVHQRMSQQTTVVEQS